MKILKILSPERGGYKTKYCHFLIKIILSIKLNKLLFQIFRVLSIILKNVFLKEIHFFHNFN